MRRYEGSGVVVERVCGGAFQYVGMSSSSGCAGAGRMEGMVGGEEFVLYQVGDWTGDD